MKPAYLNLYCFQNRVFAGLAMVWFNYFHASIFFHGMLTAYSLCCINSNALQVTFSMEANSIRPNKKSEFPVTGLKILGRIETHIFFFWKKYNFMHNERQNAFKMHKIILFPENLKKF